MRLLLTVLCMSAALTIAASTAHGQVKIASKDDTEGALLGSLVLLALERHGIRTEDRLRLGDTASVRAALVAGEIDLYPEYTGNAAFFFDRADDPVWKDADAGYRLARTLDREAHGIVWLTPAPASNAWAIAVRREIATSNGLATMSDFGRWVAGGGDVVLAASAEFVDSPAALPAFQAAYGFALLPTQIVRFPGGDTADTIDAAVSRSEGANAAMVYGTDGAVAVADLVVMADDEGVQPAYLPAPVVRAAVLREHPAIESILKPIFEALDLDTLRALNGRIRNTGVAPRAVAAAFLAERGSAR